MSINTASQLSAAEPPSIVGLLIERAELLSRRGQSEQALALFLSATAADPTPAARIAFAVSLSNTDPARAIDELEVALEESRRMGSQPFRALCCQNLARLHCRQGDCVRSSQYEQLAIAAEMESPLFAHDATFSPSLLLALAASRLMTNEFDEAEELLAAAEGLTVEADDLGANIAEHRGVLNARMNRRSMALKCFATAQRLYRDLGDDAGCAHAMVNLGHLLQDCKRFTEAHRCFRLASALFDQMSLPELSDHAEAFRREIAARRAVETRDPLLN